MDLMKLTAISLSIQTTREDVGITTTTVQPIKSVVVFNMFSVY